MTGRTRASIRAGANPGPSTQRSASAQFQQPPTLRGRKRQKSPRRENKSKRSRTAPAASSRKRNNRRRIQELDDDEDQDDDGATGLPDQRFPVKNEIEAEQEAGNLKCDYCTRNPPNAIDSRPCDRQIKHGFVFECTRCADYRCLTKDLDHKCDRSGQDEDLEVFRRYSEFQAVDFPKPIVCEECKKSKCPERCDADPFLQLTCTGCMATKARDAIPCILKASDEDLGWGRNVEREMGPKPNLQKGKLKWFRRECDICNNRPDRQNGQLCSWLSTRETDQGPEPCDECREEKMSCLTSGVLVGHPPALELPTKWTTSGDLGGGWVDLRGDSKDVFRAQCKQCSLQKRHCRAPAKYVEFACNWCWQTGMVCQDKDDPAKIYPLFDLSRVGIGNFCPFARCTRCEATGRNCDRQRPCDSCFFNNETCDTWKAGAVRTLNCLNRRINGGERRMERPGPLYYLSLGYGPNGVDDDKDGSEIEHYVGPPFPRYAFRTVKTDDYEILPQNKQCIMAEVQRMRESLVARGVPPLGAPGCELHGMNVNDITVVQLREWLTARWPAWTPQRKRSEYSEHQSREIFTKAYRTAQELETGTVSEIIVAGDEDDDLSDEQLSTYTGANTVGRTNDYPIDAPSRQQSQYFGSVSGFGSEIHMASGGEDMNPFVFGSGSANNNYNALDNGFSFSQFGAQYQDANAMRMPQMPVPSNADMSMPAPPNVAAPGRLHPFSSMTLSQPGYAGYNNYIGPSFLQFMPRHLLQNNFDLVFPYFTDPMGTATDHLSRWRSDLFPSPSEPPSEAMVMSERLQNPAGGSDFGLFSVMGGYLVRHSPVNPFLGNLLAPPSYPSTQAMCVDQGPGCNGHANMTCASQQHQPNGPVCNPCAQFGKDYLVSHADAITKREIVEMRAYFCSTCHDTLRSGPQALRDIYALGTKQVWGSQFIDDTYLEGTINFNGREMKFNSSPLPITGCSCGTNIFGEHLCRADRIKMARQIMYQADTVRNWRMMQGETGRCPGCLMRTEPNLANPSPTFAELLGDQHQDSVETVSWACLVCGDLVINQFKQFTLLPLWRRWFSENLAVSDWGPDVAESMMADAGMQQRN